jgi:prevent-host-death family protein
MKAISVSEFKATCLSVIERVRQTGQAVVITKHGHPVAELVPSRPAAEKRRGFVGRMRGKLKIVGDVMSPVMSVEEWTKGVLDDHRRTKRPRR